MTTNSTSLTSFLASLLLTPINLPSALLLVPITLASGFFPLAGVLLPFDSLHRISCTTHRTRRAIARAFAILVHGTHATHRRTHNA